MENSPGDAFELPLFPLQTVLFPGGRLPLRIFEVRYLDMIGRCHRERTPFGVVRLVAGTEVQQPSGPSAVEPEGAYAQEAFETVGTLAVIETLERPHPGLFSIRCHGTRRFELASSRRLSHGLWMGQATLLPDDPVVPVPDDLLPAVRMLERLVADCRGRVATDDDMPIRRPYRWDECGWVANRWCEILPLAPRNRQRLMELESPVVRLELVGDLLELGRPGASPAVPQ
jgi:uncharacterized protein